LAFWKWIFGRKNRYVDDAVAIVPVKDMRRTIDFYVGVLGFEALFVADDGRFATVLNGKAAIHFTQTDDATALAATANNISIYLWTTKVDRLYKKLKKLLDKLPEGRVKPPFNQPYGMREFHVKDPDGCLLFFGESIRDEGGL